MKHTQTLVRIMSGYYFEITRSTKKQDWKSSKKHRREKLYSPERKKKQDLKYGVQLKKSNCGEHRQCDTT